MVDNISVLLHLLGALILAICAAYFFRESTKPGRNCFGVTGIVLSAVAIALLIRSYVIHGDLCDQAQWKQGVMALANRQKITELDPNMQYRYELGLKKHALDDDSTLAEFVRSCLKEKITIIPPLPKNLTIGGVRIVYLKDRAVVLPELNR